MSGSFNTAVGWNQPWVYMSGSYNSAFGWNQAWYSMSGSYNSAIGGLLPWYFMSGSYNSAIGWWIPWIYMNGGYNTALGWVYAGQYMTGIYNAVIGWYAAGYSMNGGYNIAIGTYAWQFMSWSNNVYIGSYATGVLNGTNQFSIGNVIYGTGMGTGGLANGRVGIGTITPGEKLEVNGNVLATAYLYISDESLKSNIVTLTSADDILSNLRGVSFDWKNTGRKDIWFIAQEVEKILPELVHVNTVTGLKSVEYGNIVPLLVEGYKAERERSEKLEERIRQLELKLESITESRIVP